MTLKITELFGKAKKTFENITSFTALTLSDSTGMGIHLTNAQLFKMINIERFHKYIELLEGRRFFTAEECERILEISHATFKRDLAALRDRFDVPILYDRDVGAYRLDKNLNKTRLPGIWFSPEEIQAIRNICSQLLNDSNPEWKDAYQSLNSKLHRLG